MNFLLCPNSFKGSISAHEFCHIAKKTLLSLNVSHRFIVRPMADGGEHTLECIYPYLIKPKIVWAECFDPLMRPIKAAYLISEEIAYIELAKANGLNLVPLEKRNILHANTIGTGMLIKDAIDQGVKKIFLFVGGSATNDAGIGIAHALGTVYYDEEGKVVNPTPANIPFIADFEISKPYKDIEFIVATDVNNKLCGELGASYIYGPQKGASEKDVFFLDEALYHYANLLEKTTGVSVLDLEGTGASGGIAASLVALFDAKIISCSNYIFELLSLTKAIHNVDIVITGEGRFDTQSFYGKITGKIISLALEQQKKCMVFCGENLSDNQASQVDIISVNTEKELQLNLTNTSLNLKSKIFTTFQRFS